MTIITPFAGTFPDRDDPDFETNAEDLFSWIVGIPIELNGLTVADLTDGVSISPGAISADGTLHTFKVSTSEKMRINTNGVGMNNTTPSYPLVVGRIGANFTHTGMQATTAAVLHPGGPATSSGVAITILGGNASGNNGLFFADPDDNDAGAFLYNHGTNLLLMRADGRDMFYVSGDDLRPVTDDVFDLGTASFRFDNIYATNGTIQTSDRNEKQDIQEITEAERRVAVALKSKIVSYRWKSSVAEKGDDARIHFGVIAQDVEAAFLAEGLDPGRYAVFTRSPKFKTVQRERQIEQPKMQTITEDQEVIEIIDGQPVARIIQVAHEKVVTERRPLKDANGKAMKQRVNNFLKDKVGKVRIVAEDVQRFHDVHVMETVTITEDVQVEDGERLGVRYNELFAFLMAAL